MKVRVEIAPTRSAADVTIGGEEVEGELLMVVAVDKRTIFLLEPEDARALGERLIAQADALKDITALLRREHVERIQARRRKQKQRTLARVNARLDAIAARRS